MNWLLYFIALVCFVILTVIFRIVRRKHFEKMLMGSDALAATMVLGRLRDPKTVPALCERLRDDQRLVRAGAADALGKIGAPSAVKPLIEALSDKETPVRVAVAEALGKICDPRASEALTRALKDEDESVRTNARLALEDIQSRCRG